jgi:membrane-associated phospholipid phosphatase
MLAAPTTQSTIMTVLSGLFLLTIAPIALVLLLSRARKFDINMPDRKSRLAVFPLAIVCQISAVVVFTHLAIQSMVTFAALCLMVTLVVFLLNFRYKASIHAAALTGSITALVATFGAIVIPAYLFLIPVIWSRRSLRVHDFSELTAGTLIGLTIGLFVYRVPILGIGVTL